MDSTINSSGDVNFGPSVVAEYNIQSFTIVLYLILASELHVALEGSEVRVSTLHRLWGRLWINLVSSGCLEHL